MLKKILSAILAILMTASAFACAKQAGDGGSDGTTASTAANDTENENTELTPDLPDVKYDGADFTIYYSNNAEYGNVKDDFAGEAYNGEPINDARLNRNAIINEQFGVNIVTYDENGKLAGDVTKNLRTIFLAGDDTYDFIMACGYVTCVLASEGYLYDLNKVDNIDLSMPWWDQKATSDLTVLGKLFYTTGDISTADNEATYCIMFNKNMFEEYSLENPYNLVRSGDWTVDKYIEMASNVSEDIDGNGKFDGNDRYGALIWDDTMMGIVNASGEKCCTVNSDGLIELTLNTDRTVSMLEKFFEFALNKEEAYTYQRYTWEDTLLIQMFKQNQTLFIMQLMQMIPKLRDMDADFGILPYFKYDEAQQDYFITVGSWHSVFMAVPIIQKDVERTGIIAESLAYEGQELLTPAYYDITIKNKAARDEESAEMLDLIFVSRVYDLGWYYQIGGYNEEVMNLLRRYNSDFSSMYTKYETKALKSIDDINEAFAAIE